MNYIKRAVFDDFNNYLHPNKVLILLGARRVGKTQLIKKYVEVTDEKVLQLNGEDKNDARLLEERTFENYKRLLRNINLLVIDEAQAIEEIGLILKFIVDTIDGIKVIATGSSMFDLNNKLGEPLVGRKNTLYLYPLSQIEFSEYENYKETVENLEMRLIYGGYPELTHYESWYDKQKYLREIINSYLLKDILVFDGIKNSNKIYDLLRLIAFQIGKEVSLQELGKQLQLSKNTVERYLDLLTKVFIVFRVDGFSRNLRKEITKSSRWYFFDNGIRNAIIGNFNTLQNRMDIGDLWENYLVSERLKKQIYHKLYKQNYFWRTYDQQELDWLEESADNLAGYEFKWNENKKTKIPTAFAKAYPDATFEIVSKKNYLDFIL
ncbi:ATPase [Flavobacterium covae]|uniref:ATP-binding protein n=2 Tax=Flavobacterium TaxID=237 RepID=A0AA94F310_9FLAO|nr:MULTISPECIES: ATP-binding protein [Flavobacterium]OXA81603.1 ATPase [Flavobacterium columnare] [Flavobacterium columnare NBRC 100251 = ATCC 23463]AND63937.1 ATPase [Flavobacterium covae]MCH4829443.1 ATP-binding protein [Flavobacterium columnare]MCH4831563.1 ATP-binding protein [Flavobacterium columnare]OWP81357.1 ATPase [Flavobacterium covae]